MLTYQEIIREVYNLMKSYGAKERVGYMIRLNNLAEGSELTDDAPEFLRWVHGRLLYEHHHDFTSDIMVELRRVAGISDDRPAPPPVPKTEKQFWMVYRRGDRSPTREHPSRFEAVHEADRLARNNPGVQFYVLESLGCKISSIVEPTWKECK